jgi:hypothetical protein
LAAAPLVTRLTPPPNPPDVTAASSVFEERTAVYRVVVAATARRTEGRHHRAQPLRSRIRQRPEEQRIDDREDRGVDADADREGDERDQREPGRLAQHPQRVAGVACQRVHHSSLPQNV